MKFIYALNKEDKEGLINQGFKFLMEAKLDLKTVYVFENEVSYEKFKTLDKSKYLVSDMLFI